MSIGKRNVRANMPSFEEFSSDSLHDSCPGLNLYMKHPVLWGHTWGKIWIFLQTYLSNLQFITVQSLCNERKSPHTSDYVCRRAVGLISAAVINLKIGQLPSIGFWKLWPHHVTPDFRSFDKNSTYLLIEFSEMSHHEGIFDLPYLPFFCTVSAFSFPYSARKTK